VSDHGQSISQATSHAMSRRYRQRSRPCPVCGRKTVQPRFDSRHVCRWANLHPADRWEVSGPVTSRSMNTATGAMGEPTDLGYGVRAVEPAQFGGTEIVSQRPSRWCATTTEVASERIRRRAVTGGSIGACGAGPAHHVRQHHR
jgi:hypothetical protein